MGIFQGALLDSTKRNTNPFAINPLGGFSKKLQEDNPRDFAAPQDADPYSHTPLSRRHTYFQEVPDHKPPIIVPSGKNEKYFLSQEKRLGVRLRARQVLCSKCSSVCNEKGENVRENSKKEPQSSGTKTPHKIVRPKARGHVTDLKVSISSQESTSTSSKPKARP